MFWGFGCDIFGRKTAFNLTLGVTAVFGMIAAGSPNFAAIGCFAALWSFGVGGNLPVDSAVFLEFLPGSHQYLLTVLSVDWAFAQVIATLVAWPLLGNLTCQQDETCTRSKNMGWRYFVIAMGGISLIEFVVRFVFFTVFESPKFLMGKGRDEDAVRVVHEVARRNGKTSTRKFISSHLSFQYKSRNFTCSARPLPLLQQLTHHSINRRSPRLRSKQHRYSH